MPLLNCGLFVCFLIEHTRAHGKAEGRERREEKKRGYGKGGEKKREDKRGNGRRERKEEEE